MFAEENNMFCQTGFLQYLVINRKCSYFLNYRASDRNERTAVATFIENF